MEENKLTHARSVCIKLLRSGTGSVEIKTTILESECGIVGFNRLGAIIASGILLGKV